MQKTIPTPEIFGPESGDVLVCGWGSTYGSIKSAVEQLRSQGKSVAAVHMRHIWPLAPGLDEMFGRYRTVLVPELNLGQLARLLRSEFPHHAIASYPKVQGLPFTTAELVDRIEVVVRFLAVLELFKQGVVELDQVTAFGDITVIWTGGEDVNADAIVIDTYEG